MRLLASPRAVITHYLHLPGEGRVSNIVNRVLKMDDPAVEQVLQDVRRDFTARHRNINDTFMDHFARAAAMYGRDITGISNSRKLLIGAYFTKEYSIQSAALFNPSIVTHPIQDGVAEGEKRFIMSLRATGEGHISSIVFQTGIVDRNGTVNLDQAAKFYTRVIRKEDTIYTKNEFINLIQHLDITDTGLLDLLPSSFSRGEVMEKLSILKSNHVASHQLSLLESLLDKNYELVSPPGIPINERVIFPSSMAESMGMEDVRFVEFVDGDELSYYGTYTAYNGKQIVSQLIETKDFETFKVRSLQGAAVSDKGMALFPSKVDGKYVMVSRQGGEKISIMFSTNLYQWDTYQTLLEPKYAWELVQLGNCGSPIKTEHGWLLLTHGVGAVRTYVISAILLDLSNPSMVIGRLSKPLIVPEETEREGYVPNVVYTCGMLLHENVILVPYAVSDSAADFATVQLDELLGELLSTSNHEQ
ncbi:MAG TPA: glycoside hydrolase family 130 protein [Flavitalea sp.]|nr:glycoside hydrolase family 130 protein [Flavitalea sp.]